MIRERLLERARAEFDRLAAEQETDIRRRLEALGYSPALIDDIITDNAPNMRAAWQTVQRDVTIRAILLEVTDG